MTTATKTPDNQELVDTYRRYRQLRRQHVRRTRLIGGRLWLGPVAEGVATVVILGAAATAALAAAGIGLDVDLAAMQAAGVLLISLLFLGVVGVYQAKRAAPGRGPAPTPAREMISGLCLAFIGITNVVSRDAAQILGSLLIGVSAMTLGRGTLRVIGAGLRRVFGTRPGPEELEPILTRPV